MALRPAPEPSGEYWTVTPWFAVAKLVFQTSIAAPCAEEPMPVRVPVTLEPAWPPVAAVGLSEPQAVSASAPAAMTAMAVWRLKRNDFTGCAPSRVSVRSGPETT
jgi:hypothetical protein